MVSQNESEAKARIGKVLGGKWTLRRLLGVGGAAAVYEAEHRNRNRAAIKIMHRSLAADDAQQRRFRREPYAANSIEHPGVVSVLDDDLTEDGEAYLVMDLLSGEPLDVCADRLTGDEVLDIAGQLLDVLVAAHGAGVVHRDIKPGNLLLTDDGELKVLDFGIAHVAERPPELTAQTSAGEIMGTPAFMAPEQARAKWDLVDERTDIWSVGATLFFLLSGRTVHEGDTANELLGKSMTLPARSLREVAPDASDALVSLVDGALGFERDERFPTAAAMRTALDQVKRGEVPDRAATLSPISGPQTLVGPASRDAERDTPRRAVWPLGVAVAAAGVMVGVFVWKSGADSHRALGGEPSAIVAPDAVESVTAAVVAVATAPSTDPKQAPHPSASAQPATSAAVERASSATAAKRRVSQKPVRTDAKADPRPKATAAPAAASQPTPAAKQVPSGWDGRLDRRH